MHTSKRRAFFVFWFALAAPAQAALTDSFASFDFQVKSRQISAAEDFWDNFWNTLGGRRPREGDLSVKVRDSEGRPLSGAWVLVGMKKGDPFPGNFQQTDQEGRAVFSHERLRAKDALALTAGKDGFSTLTLMENQANEVELTLQDKPDERDFAFFQGRLHGFPQGYDGGTLELGFFLPAFRPESLMNFDPQQFISSYRVKINVYGERKVPGNLVLPPQQKHWGLIPISLSKPDFIMPLPKRLRAHMAGILGAVPISDAMNAIQKKDFLATLNLATLTHVGWTQKRVEVRGDEHFDVNAGEPLEQGALTARLFSLPAKLDVAAVSMVDPSGDRGDFVAMDVKAAKAEQLPNGRGALRIGSLKRRRPKDDIYVFAGLFDRTQLENSSTRSGVGALVPVPSDKTVADFRSFLRPMRAIGVSAGNREYRFSSAANRERGLRPNLLILNVVSERRNPATQGRTRAVIWSAVLPGNADRLTLPDLGRPVLPAPDAASGERFHWEVTALSTTGERPSGELNLQAELRSFQHVSTLSQTY